MYTFHFNIGKENNFSTKEETVKLFPFLPYATRNNNRAVKENRRDLDHFQRQGNGPNLFPVQQVS